MVLMADTSSASSHSPLGTRRGAVTLPDGWLASVYMTVATRMGCACGGRRPGLMNPLPPLLLSCGVGTGLASVRSRTRTPFPTPPKPLVARMLTGCALRKLQAHGAGRLAVAEHWACRGRATRGKGDRLPGKEGPNPGVSCARFPLGFCLELICCQQQNARSLKNRSGRGPGRVAPWQPPRPRARQGPRGSGSAAPPWQAWSSGRGPPLPCSGPCRPWSWRWC